MKNIPIDFYSKPCLVQISHLIICLHTRSVLETSAMQELARLRAFFAQNSLSVPTQAFKHLKNVVSKVRPPPQIKIWSGLGTLSFPLSRIILSPPPPKKIWL